MREDTKKEILRTSVLTVILVLYLVIGAAVFQALEEGDNPKSSTNSTAQLSTFLARGTCFNSSDLEALIWDVIKAYDQGSISLPQTRAEETLALDNYVFFAATVVTTIGYGNITPKTVGGRIFTIFYALVGIPLTAFFLIVIGEKIHKPVKIFKKKVFWKKHKRPEKILKSILIALAGLLVLILIPAALFIQFKDWTYFEAIYFGVITLTTIGFGDLVPTTVHRHYQILCALWVFTGLAWVSMILTDVGDYIKKTDKTLGRQLDKKVSKRKSGEYETKEESTTSVTPTGTFQAKSETN